MMKSNQGQSLTEYGLVLGLIAIVSIAGLIMFGQNLSNVFTNLAGGKSASTAQVAAPAPALPLVTNLDLEPTAPAAPPPRPTMTASYDPKTGQILFQTSDGASDGKITTGDQGTEAIAQALVYLAKTATKDDGTPADPEIVNLITQLGEKYHQMAEKEKLLTLNPPSPSELPSRDDPAYWPLIENDPAHQQYWQTGLPELHKETHDLYNLVKTFSESNPEYAKVMGQVDTASGIASSIFQTTYVARYDQNATKIYGSNGTPLTGEPVSVELAPPTTHVAASDLERTGKTVPSGP